MDPVLFRQGLAIAVIAALLAGAFVLYELTKRASWLAPATVSSLLFVAGTLLVLTASGAAPKVLAPMWIAYAVAGVVHLSHASGRRSAARGPARRR